MHHGAVMANSSAAGKPPVQQGRYTSAGRRCECASDGLAGKSNPDFSTSEINFQKNQYINLNCGCSSPSTDACSHSGFMSDPDVIDHIINYTTNSRNRLDDKEFSENMDIVGKGINRVETGLICSNLKIVNEILKFNE